MSEKHEWSIGEVEVRHTLQTVNVLGLRFTEVQGSGPHTRYEAEGGAFLRFDADEAAWSCGCEPLTQTSRYENPAAALLAFAESLKDVAALVAKLEKGVVELHQMSTLIEKLEKGVGAFAEACKKQKEEQEGQESK